MRVRGDFMAVMKDKVRRKRISWLKELERLGNPDLNHEFIQRLSLNFKHTHLSYNRCAYYVLKNYYHTTTIDELVGKLYELR